MIQARRTSLKLAALLLLGASLGFTLLQDTQPSVASHYQIDAVHSSVIFRIQHVGAGQFWGRFNAISGSFTYAEGSDSDLSFDVSIPILSIDTNSESRDKHLKSPDFFNAKEYADMTFKSTSAKKVGENMYKVTGDFTMRGVTKSITSDVEWTGSNDAGARFGYRCGFEAVFTINRSEFGMSYGLGGVLGDSVRIIVAMEGQRQ